MSVNRITYADWIVERGRDPNGTVTIGKLSGAEEARVERIRETVSRALEGLTEDEREFVVRFYFQGMSYRRIAEDSGRARHKLRALHGRALRRLKQALAPFVREEFGLESGLSRSCPICDSEHREEIDALIAARDRKATWRPVIIEINRRFGLKLRAPQTLIGHEKYHRQRQVVAGPVAGGREEEEVSS